MKKERFKISNATSDLRRLSKSKEKIFNSFVKALNTLEFIDFNEILTEDVKFIDEDSSMYLGIKSVTIRFKLVGNIIDNCQSKQSCISFFPHVGPKTTGPFYMIIFEDSSINKLLFIIKLKLRTKKISEIEFVYNGFYEEGMWHLHEPVFDN